MAVANKGKSWTSEEMDTLLSELRQKKTDKEIAEAHGRTVNAIKFKALGYACDQVLKEGKTKEEVLLDLGLSEGELQKEMDKRTMPRPVANVLAKVTEKKPLVVVKKAQKASADDLAEILSTVNRLQSLIQRYKNNEKQRESSRNALHDLQKLV
jgi:translation initiation factor IF-2